MVFCRFGKAFPQTVISNNSSGPHVMSGKLDPKVKFVWALMVPKQGEKNQGPSTPRCFVPLVRSSGNVQRSALSPVHRVVDIDGLALETRPQCPVMCVCVKVCSNCGTCSKRGKLETPPATPHSKSSSFLFL